MDTDFNRKERDRKGGARLLTSRFNSQLSTSAGRQLFLPKPVCRGNIASWHGRNFHARKLKQPSGPFSRSANENPARNPWCRNIWRNAAPNATGKIVGNRNQDQLAEIISPSPPRTGRGPGLRARWHQYPSEASLPFRRQCQENFFELAGTAALAAEFVAIAHRDQSSVVNDADAVRHFLRHAQLVRGDEHGHALA